MLSSLTNERLLAVKVHKFTNDQTYRAALGQHARVDTAIRVKHAGDGECAGT